MIPGTPPEDGSEGKRKGGWQAPGGRKVPPQNKPLQAKPSAKMQPPKPQLPIPSKPFRSKTPPPPVQDALKTQAPPRRRTEQRPPARPISETRAPAPTARAGTLRSRKAAFQIPVTLRGPRIVSSGEQTLFWVLLASVLVMSIFLVHYREQVNAHFDARAEAVPLAAAAAGAPLANLELYVADDDTGNLSRREIAFPVPADPNVRAQVVVEKLLAGYSLPGSPHFIPAGPPGAESVNHVYLVPLGHGHSGRSQLAVVDLTASFLHRQPSGIEPESLTLLSIIATLHANLPAVTQVHFLVDGEPRSTLAGHAELTQTYVAGNEQMVPRAAFQSSPNPPNEGHDKP
jgi:hypothetical protein